MPAVGGSRGDVGRGGGLRLAGAGWRGFGAAGYRGSGVRCVGAGCHDSAYGRGDGNTRAPGGAGISHGDGSGGRDARTARSGAYADSGRDGGAQSVAHADPGRDGGAQSVAHADPGRDGSAEPVADSRGFRAADADAGWDCGADVGGAG